MLYITYFIYEKGYLIDERNDQMFVFYRRGFEGVLLGVCSSVDVTQSEGDLPDFNQSEH